RPRVTERRLVGLDQIFSIRMVFHCPLAVETGYRPSWLAVAYGFISRGGLIGVRHHLHQQVGDRLPAVGARLVWPRGCHVLSRKRQGRPGPGARLTVPPRSGPDPSSKPRSRSASASRAAASGSPCTSRTFFVRPADGPSSVRKSSWSAWPEKPSRSTTSAHLFHCRPRKRTVGPRSSNLCPRLCGAW